MGRVAVGEVAQDQVLEVLVRFETAERLDLVADFLRAARRREQHGHDHQRAPFVGHGIDLQLEQLGRADELGVEFSQQRRGGAPRQWQAQRGEEQPRHGLEVEHIGERGEDRDAQRRAPPGRIRRHFGEVRGLAGHRLGQCPASGVVVQPVADSPPRGIAGRAVVRRAGGGKKDFPCGNRLRSGRKSGDVRRFPLCPHLSIHRPRQILPLRARQNYPSIGRRPSLVRWDFPSFGRLTSLLRKGFP